MFVTSSRSNSRPTGSDIATSAVYNVFMNLGGGVYVFVMHIATLACVLITGSPWSEAIIVMLNSWYRVCRRLYATSNTPVLSPDDECGNYGKWIFFTNTPSVVITKGGGGSE